MSSKGLLKKTSTRKVRPTSTENSHHSGEEVRRVLSRNGGKIQFQNFVDTTPQPKPQRSIRKTLPKRMSFKSLLKRRVKNQPETAIGDEDDDNGEVSSNVIRQVANEIDNWSSVRVTVYQVVTSSWFSNIILTVIIFNTVLISLQTVQSAQMASGYYFSCVDNVLLGIYIWELVMKIYALRGKFFMSGWNVFDMCVVCSSVFEQAALFVFQHTSSELNPSIFRLVKIFRAFRALRALRVLRTISFLRNLQLIVNTLLRSIPAMGSIVLLLFLVLYIFAIIGVHIYKDIFPERFGTIWVAFFSLFQLITLDDWFEFYYSVRSVDVTSAHWMIVYLMVFIVLETFIFINLFIAVIVNNLERLQNINQKRKELDAKRIREEKELKQAKLSKRIDPLANKNAQRARDYVPSYGLAKSVEVLDTYYEDLNVSMKERAVLNKLFHRMACLDENVAQFNDCLVTLNALVDIAKEAPESENHPKAA